MSLLLLVLLTTLGISLLAFAGAFILLVRTQLLDRWLMVLVAFSAGTLLAAAFVHLLPKAAARADTPWIFLGALGGFSVFFVLEQFIRWHHHHAQEHPEVMPFSYLILVSDSVHNFIDGVLIASAFALSFETGIITALAVALHEIPQEIGDFGVLLYGGFRRGTALVLNFITALTVVLGGVVGVIAAHYLTGVVVWLLAFAAGGFMYIASTDLVPELHCSNRSRACGHALVFFAGMGVLIIIRVLLG